jgi:hypothetical protein
LIEAQTWFGLFLGRVGKLSRQNEALSLVVAFVVFSVSAVCFSLLADILAVYVYFALLFGRVLDLIRSSKCKTMYSELMPDGST